MGGAAFVCPACGRPLGQSPESKALRCARGHSYDIAAQGYVNLTVSGRKGGHESGDNADMIMARTQFLDSGAYAPLSDVLCAQVNALLPPPSGSAPALLDLGCGEGYYARRLYSSLEGRGDVPALFGVDLSRCGVKHAARHCPGGRFAVASIFALPFPDACMHACYNIFSPLCPGETARVLRRGGYFFAAYPAPRHLFAMKEVLYEKPYLNAQEDYQLPGLSLVDRQQVTYSFTLESQSLIQSLFTMTPYYYKTPPAGRDRLAALDCLTTEADFWLVTYQKQQ